MISDVQTTSMRLDARVRLVAWRLRGSNNRKLPFHRRSGVRWSAEQAVQEQEKPTWTFLTNHAAVLLCIARDSGVRTRDIASKVEITERAVQRIVADLEAEGYITRTRVGRRNVYEISAERELRHPVTDDQQIGELLDLLRSDTGEAGAAR